MAPARSFHQPLGREPSTLATSTTSSTGSVRNPSAQAAANAGISGNSETSVSGTQRSSRLSLFGTVSSALGASATTVVYVHSTRSSEICTSGGIRGPPRVGCPEEACAAAPDVDRVSVVALSSSDSGWF